MRSWFLILMRGIKILTYKIETYERRTGPTNYLIIVVINFRVRSIIILHI